MKTVIIIQSIFIILLLIGRYIDSRLIKSLKELYKLNQDSIEHYKGICDDYNNFISDLACKLSKNSTNDEKSDVSKN